MILQLLFNTLLLLLLMVTVNASKPDERCGASIEKQHHENCALETNYQVYVECIREQRAKRSADCDNSCEDTNDCSDSSCSDCSCDSCETDYSDCCNSCCNVQSSCTTNHCCHKTCHASCRTSSCRTSCRKSCYSSVKAKSDQISSSSNTKTSTNNTNLSAHNITTVIHLNNLINNTNIIDAPIKINTTNYNNISIPVSATLRGGSTSETVTKEERSNCCKVMTPRQCVPQEKFPFLRCFHMRYSVCGQMCQSNIMHAQPHEVCDEVQQGPPSCHQQVIYVPQPQPRCAYTSSWPYVSCGIQQQQQPNCGGCYGHLSNRPPFMAQQQQQVDPSCNSLCYDDGFALGSSSLYRQGPFYQQTPPSYAGYNNFVPQMSPPSIGYNPNQYEDMFVMYKFAGNQSDLVKVDEPLIGGSASFNPMIETKVSAPNGRFAEITIDSDKE